MALNKEKSDDIKGNLCSDVLKEKNTSARRNSPVDCTENTRYFCLTHSLLCYLWLTNHGESSLSLKSDGELWIVQGQVTWVSLSKIKFVSISMFWSVKEREANALIHLTWEKPDVLIHPTWEKVNIENNIPNIGRWKFLDWIWSNSGIFFQFNYFQPAKKPKFRWLWRLWQFVRE